MSLYNATFKMKILLLRVMQNNSIELNYKPNQINQTQTTVSENKDRVCYHLCIPHTFSTVFELNQSSENTHRYFHIIKNKTTYRPSYAT